MMTSSLSVTRGIFLVSLATIGANVATPIPATEYVKALQVSGLQVQQVLNAIPILTSLFPLSALGT
jgi:hypothetical protein